MNFSRFQMKFKNLTTENKILCRCEYSIFCVKIYSFTNITKNCMLFQIFLGHDKVLLKNSFANVMFESNIFEIINQKNSIVSVNILPT